MEEINEYYIDIFLTETYKSLGQYEIITNPDIVGELKEFSLYDLTQYSNKAFEPPQELEFIVITGLTSSKLEEVRTYNLNEPYKVGVKGVTNITNDFIEYKINDIEYKTYINNSVTTPSNPDTDTNNIDTTTSARLSVTPNQFTITNQPISFGVTTFKVIKQKQNFQNDPVIWNADSVFIDIKKTLNAMVIDRGYMPVYDYFNKINNCDTLDDILDIF